jgi:hypothetical protein
VHGRVARWQGLCVRGEARSSWARDPAEFSLAGQRDRADRVDAFGWAQDANFGMLIFDN